MGMSDWIYNLKYKDADGNLTEREIEIKSLRLGSSPSYTYIRAFCHSANDMRTFRLDRVRSLYLGNQKIDNPMEYLIEKLEAGEIQADTEALETEAVGGAPETIKQPVVVKSPFPKITDIQRAKKGIRNLYIIAGTLTLIGFISISTVILPILFFGGALFVLACIRDIKKQIKETEAEVK
jgi:hypothetical protein